MLQKSSYFKVRMYLKLIGEINMKISIEFDSISQLWDIKKSLSVAQVKIAEGYYISETAEENIELIKNRINDAIFDNS